MTVNELENVGIIKEIHIEKKANCHSYCKIKMFIGDENKLNELKKKLTNDVCVEDDNRIYMRGTIRNISYEKTFYGSNAIITIISYSDKADMERQNRIFQNTEKRYKDIIATLYTSDVDYQITSIDFANTVEENLILQDNQTDFEFINMIVKNKGYDFFVNDTDSKCIINIGKNAGVSQNDINEENITLFNFHKDENAEYVSIQTNINLELGQKTIYEYNNYIVAAVSIKYKNGTTHFTYMLKRVTNRKNNYDFVTKVLGKAKVTDNTDPDNLGRIQVQFEDYEDVSEDNRIWIPYIPLITEKNQGTVLVPGMDEVVNVFCNNGKCYSDGCIRQTSLDEKIKNVENRTVMFGDKILTFTKDKVELTAFDIGILVEDKKISITNNNNAICIQDNKVIINSNDTKININDSVIQLLTNENVDIKANRINLDGSNKISAKTSSFDVG